ncbi:MAG: J domain-containing protein [Parvibaculaceae bacterium]|nr:J domain-containing protein [Parvibaculaceae bacterium]
MTSNSKYFDSIRISTRKGRGGSSAPSPEIVKHVCEWAGCKEAGTHRAPRAPMAGEAPAFHHFCLRHVSEYNRNYDFFKGMPEDEVSRFQKDALTGHRPTWGMGQNAFSSAARARAAGTDRAPFGDPFEIFEGAAGAGGGARRKPPVRKPRALERQALETLGFEDTPTLNEIKARYKELVKRHHPDANGGDRSSEEQLRKVIQAYDYLKKSGFVPPAGAKPGTKSGSK